MSGADIFPDLDSGEVHDATAERWSLVAGVPIPRGDWLRCPVCGGNPQARWWQWHTRPAGHTVPWRCDVSFKCTACAYVWFHGVVLPKAAWVRRPFPGRERERVKWREVRAVVGDGHP